MADPAVSRDSLDILKVLTRLEVGPIRVEPRRIVAPYRVTYEGTSSTIDLIYRYEEDVFDPNDPDALNLAAMVAAQVALNYGLFCDEIRFHGPFDPRDRRFLEDMARNTAREIFVKKFLAPNPFLVGPAASLSPVRRKSYLQARLVFDNGGAGSSDSTSAGQSNRRRPSSWRSNSRKHAVLSSGGKDSLLTFGLLEEIGAEVQAIFVNESGRHWFTALNAYRHFAEHVPGTGRVWTNADRVFNWMLRHLPFVRKDFANLRADDYPIRLWTVAVFLFGVLPLLRKRGIGRLLIGDEYDATRRLSYQGITHYDGYYDQSRFFDTALTRYFYAKGWNISQLSILRPLSELLIEKILATRYPELLRHQVSCHAAHKEGERIHPCGRCEKCRRIIGLLTAFGADPTVCGYSREAIESCLAQLRADGLKMEIEGSRHLLYLLRQRGLIDPKSNVGKQPRMEIEKLRFDPERSPVEGLPVDLREPLFRIFLQHARGAVRRRGRLWLDFDLLADPVMLRPYAFEFPFVDGKSAESSSRRPRAAGLPGPGVLSGQIAGAAEVDASDGTGFDDTDGFVSDTMVPQDADEFVSDTLGLEGTDEFVSDTMRHEASGEFVSDTLGLEGSDEFGSDGKRLEGSEALPSEGTGPEGADESACESDIGRSTQILGELTWPEARERFRRVDIALLPVGAIEQHGPHLPLDTDAFDADYLARRVAEACRPPGPLVLPLIPYGVSYHHEDFAGTLGISPDTLSRLVYEIGLAAARYGITKLVIINGHGGNSPALHFAAQMINRDAHIFTCVDSGETSDPDIEALAETPNDVHAGEIETSTTMAIRPEAVRTQAARRFVPRFSSRYLDFTSKRSVGWYTRTVRISPDGVLGDPTKATREKGEKMWAVMISHLVDFVQDLQGMSLDEIYQKRY